jgi:2,5-diamino-6-(ribosylamino)-4(3H)-pyrimidinone 5'-phosphate reductase
MTADVIINCAMTADGKIALPDGTRLTISSEEDFARVHSIRNKCDAILVGVETILKDNPGLLVKKKYVKRPKHPLRVVLDSKARTPARAKVMDASARTLIAVTKGHTRKARRKVRWDNVEVKAFGRGKVDIRALLDHLCRSGMKSVLVEGGGTVIWTFIEAGLVDELSIFVGDMVVGGTGPTPASGKGARTKKDIVKLELVSAKKMEGGVLLRYLPRKRK